MLLISLFVFLNPFFSCNPDSSSNDPSEGVEKFADVQKVVVEEVNNNQFRFSVTVASPDTGCDQFADWWEVISEEGELLSRRILLHSHIQEQPFTRTGSPFEVGPNQTLVIRAHMNNNGYGGQVLQGNINDGFEFTTFTDEYDKVLSETEPLPKGCTN